MRSRSPSADPPSCSACAPIVAPPCCGSVVNVVDPGAEQRGFHGSMPGLPQAFRPAPQYRPFRLQGAFLHNLAVCGLYAIADGFLVYVQSDIVDSIHGVLLIEISESTARNSRSQQCNLEENPFSLRSKPFPRYLYIQTDGT